MPLPGRGGFLCSVTYVAKGGGAWGDPWGCGPCAGGLRLMFCLTPCPVRRGYRAGVSVFTRSTGGGGGH